MDFQKAFDNVSHNELLGELILESNLWLWLKFYFSLIVLINGDDIKCFKSVAAEDLVYYPMTWTINFIHFLMRFSTATLV